MSVIQEGYLAVRAVGAVQRGSERSGVTTEEGSVVETVGHIEVRVPDGERHIRGVRASLGPASRSRELGSSLSMVNCPRSAPSQVRHEQAQASR